MKKSEWLLVRVRELKQTRNTQPSIKTTREQPVRTSVLTNNVIHLTMPSRPPPHFLLMLLWITADTPPHFLLMLLWVIADKAVSVQTVVPPGSSGNVSLASTFSQTFDVCQPNHQTGSRLKAGSVATITDRWTSVGKFSFKISWISL